MQIFTIAQAAEALGVRYHTLSDAILRKAIKPPQTDIGHRRKYYLTPDIETMRKQLSEKPRNNNRPPKGFISVNKVAERCGVNECAIRYHIKRGRFDAPTNKFQNAVGCYYAEFEAKIIEKIMRERKGFLVKAKRGRKAA